MKDRSDWTRGDAGPKIINGKTYRKLVEFKRPCVTCGGVFSIFVTEKIAAGHADSNSFGLKNCEQHRRNRVAADNISKDELAAAHEVNFENLARIKEQFEEIQVLKAKLAKYELPAALEEMAKNKSMPWE